MRILVCTDVHANLEALQAVFSDADARGGFEEVWVLGDLVGYGPDPEACVRLLREYPLSAVAGNHDHAAVGKLDPVTFNHAAEAAARWTSGQLSDDTTLFLSSLPLVVFRGAFTLVHGSLRAPIHEYLLNEESARGTLRLMRSQFCMVGHSHYPFLCQEEEGSPAFVEFQEGRSYPLDGRRWIINPGGLGQPRDRDPRANYAIYDDAEGTVEHRRVTYDIAATQAKIRKAGLPEYLAARLSDGV